MKYWWRRNWPFVAIALFLASMFGLLFWAVSHDVSERRATTRIGLDGGLGVYSIYDVDRDVVCYVGDHGISCLRLPKDGQ